MDEDKRLLKSPARRAGLIALLAVASAVFLRLNGLTDYSLSPDEGIDYRIAHESSMRAAVPGILGNAHPPLFYVVLRLMAPLGAGLLWMRLPSFIFGCLAVLGMYLLGRRIAGPAAGFLCALVLALSPSAVVLSQVIRPYAMQMAFVVFCLFFAVSWLREARRRFLVGYSIALLLAILTHYTSIILLSAAGIVLVCKACTSRPRGPVLRDVVLAHIPAILILVPLFIFHLQPHVIGSGIHIEARDGWLKPFFVTSPGETWSGFLGLVSYLAGRQYAGILALLFVGGLLATLFRREYLLAALSILALALAIAFSAAGQLPFGGSRHSFYLLPFLAIPAACLAGLILSLAPPQKTAAMMVFCLILAFPGPLNRLLRFETSATVSAQAEQITTTGDYDRVLSVLKRVEAAGGLIVCDLQTYCYLGMEFNGWTPVSRSEEETSFKVLTKTNCHVIVAEDAWCIGADPEGGSKELKGLLERLSSALPDLHLTTRDSIWIAQGGWGCPLAAGLNRQNEQAESPAQEFVLDSHGAPGIDLLEIAPAVYLRTAAP